MNSLKIKKEVQFWHSLETEIFQVIVSEKALPVEEMQYIWDCFKGRQPIPDMYAYLIKPIITKLCNDFEKNVDEFFSVLHSVVYCGPPEDVCKLNNS